MLKVGDIVKPVPDFAAIGGIEPNFRFITRRGRTVNSHFFVVLKVSGPGNLTLGSYPRKTQVFGSCWDKKHYDIDPWWHGACFERISAFEMDALDAIYKKRKRKADKCLTKKME